ncbi:Plasmid stabilization system [Desulfamplus magnetovallimortis]|uniref:Plasmid stabilization system n=1 Tax=Desulfamplus magnetovallimortis TaxID=1246637 RepID=A0A1W1H9K8_9BACT|nr:type II toxin-antitoxin system mRNA interferase toxin, RelE/StbE family [Desulfamplus magnetovallimortis]SLM29126.1 Plasmid stabilization system [Desulfamplus magnetovallimortis]
MYKDEYHPQVKKDLKKIDTPIRKKIKEDLIPEILQNPEIGVSLTGDLNGIQSYHFTYARKQYRIAYIVDEDDKIVFIQMVAKRGDFYTLLKRRI